MDSFDSQLDSSPPILTMTLKLNWLWWALQASFSHVCLEEPPSEYFAGLMPFCNPFLRPLHVRISLDIFLQHLQYSHHNHRHIIFSGFFMGQVTWFLLSVRFSCIVFHIMCVISQSPTFVSFLLSPDKIPLYTSPVSGPSSALPWRSYPKLARVIQPVGMLWSQFCPLRKVSSGPSAGPPHVQIARNNRRYLVKEVTETSCGSG